MIDPMSSGPSASSFSIPTAGIGAPVSPHPTRKLLQPSPDHPDDYVLELDYSSTAKINECWRQGENYLIHSRESRRDSSATSFGKLFHECEELRLRNGYSDALVQRQRELVSSHFVSHPVSPTDHRTAPRMLAVLDQYKGRYEFDGWEKKIVQYEDGPLIERPFKIPLCSVELDIDVPYQYQQLVVDSSVLKDPTDPHYRFNTFRIRNLHFVYTGRVDLAIEDSGYIFTVDHKTSSMGGREFEDYFRLSLQTRGYTWALQRILQRPVNGFILNALIIKAPTKSVYNNTELDRKTYFYSQDSLDEWELTMHAICEDFAHKLVRGHFPQTGPRSFKSICPKCDYQENCILPRAQRAADLASPLYRDVTWNPVH